MKLLRNKFFSGYNLIISSLMALLGFSSSCGKFPMMEYGTPHATFIVKGKITSSENSNPVPNIKIKMGIDSTLSDNNGNYQVVDNFGFPVTHSYSIQFMDLDGTQNGDLQNLDTIVEFIDPVFTGGDGHWDNGETKKEFNITLKPKK